MPEETEEFKSRKGDRRKQPTPFLGRYTFTGRRRTARRKDEQYNYYVDRPGAKVWAVIAIVIILSITDSIFTIRLLQKGYIEINPFMDRLISFGGRPVFVILKYIFTSIGVLTLGLHKNFRFIKELIAVIITFYMLLNGYHLWLFMQ